MSSKSGASYNAKSWRVSSMLGGCGKPPTDCGIEMINVLKIIRPINDVELIAIFGKINILYKQLA